MAEVLGELVRAYPGKTAAEYFAMWPGPRRPHKGTVKELLRALTEAGRLAQTGAGHRYEPYRYTAAGDELPPAVLELGEAVAGQRDVEPRGAPSPVALVPPCATMPGSAVQYPTEEPRCESPS